MVHKEMTTMVKARTPVEMGFERLRLMFSGMMVSGMLAQFIYPPITDSAAEWVIMLYGGFVLMATFWNDV
jgi:hypothetical protein